MSFEPLDQIFDRIRAGTQTEADLATLEQALKTRPERLQLGKYNVQIGEGKDFHIGDRTYIEWNEEAMQALITAIQQLGSAPPPRLEPVADLPAVSPTFVGRTREMAQIQASFRESRLVAIVGMGGVGKSALAIQYAHQRAADYPGGRVCLRGEEENLVPHFLAQFQGLGISLPEQLSPIEQVAYGWHHWPGAGPVLVILDQVASLSKYRELLPQADRFHLLLTTRQQRLDPTIREVSLSVLEEAGALDLLSRLVQDDQRGSAAHPLASSLCRRLGYLPLAIELVGRYLYQNSGISLAQVLERLQAQGLEDLSLDLPADGDLGLTRFQRGVKATLALTWEALTPESQALALLLALFPPGLIPWALVREMGRRLDWSLEQEQQASTVLVNYQVVQADRPQTDCRLHPLVREFLRGHLWTAAQRQRFQQVYGAVRGQGGRSPIPRQNCEAALRTALERLGQQPHNQLVLYGAPGMGKSTLAEQLWQALQGTHPCALLSGTGLAQALTESRQGELALAQLRKQLGVGQVDFSLWDVAYACYQGHQGAVPPARQFFQMLDELDTVSSSRELVRLVLEDWEQQARPYAQTLDKLIWLMLLTPGGLWAWWRQRGYELNELATLKEQPDQMRQRLCRWLARDLDYHLQQRGQRAVILIDDYDQLAAAQEDGGWLQALMAVPNRFVLWVLLVDHPGPGSGEATVPLLPLAEAEMGQWLRDAGVTQAAAIETLVHTAQGSPLLLNLGLEVWQRWRQGAKPEIPGLAQQLQAGIQEISADWHPQARQLWQVLALLIHWDRPLLEALLPQVGLGDWLDRWEQIITSPFVEALGEERWRLRPALQQYWQAQAQTRPTNPEMPLPGASASVQDWVFAYYWQQNETDPVTRIYQALPYGVNSREALDQCLGQMQALPDQAPVWIGPLWWLLATAPLTLEQAALAQMVVGQALSQARQWEAAVDPLEQAQQAWEQLEGAESLNLATVSSELGRVYLWVGRTFDANNACLRALRIRRQRLGQQHPLVAEVLNRQSAVAETQGNLREALRLGEQALEILEATAQDDPLAMIQQYGEVAVLCLYGDRLDRGAELCRLALELSRQTLGTDHRLTIGSQQLLGQIYHRMGQHRYQSAVDCYQGALDQAESSWGPTHPQTESLVQTLERFFQTVGQPEAARQFTERLQVKADLLNREETVQMALRLNNLGFAFYEQGRYGKAEPLWKRALAIRERELGVSHPNTASSLNSLAALYNSMGRYSEAEPLLERALAIRERELGASHPDTARSLNNLALLYYSMGRSSEAEPLYERALAIYERELGASHPDTARSLNNLALLYYSMGRSSEAEPLYERALAIYERELGASHPDTARSLNNLAELYRAMGRTSEAELLLARLREIG